jgi:DNA ligase (NAD+)
MERMKQLVARLNEASTTYYKYDKPIMTDMEYDIIYDELTELEKTSGIILANSPTQKVQGEILEGLVKVKHSKPMLSAQKTKDVEEIKKFISNNYAVVSWKEDGLTIVLRYKNGELVQAITRGSGSEGEDVTHTVKTFTNVPLKIKYCADIEVRGEGLISWNNFNDINENLEEKYSHPRNLAAGSVRQLNATIVKERKLSFKAFELVQEMSDYDFHNQGLDKFDSLEYLKDCGFDVVEHKLIKAEDVEKTVKEFNPAEYEYPVDGLIFEINDRFLAKELGTTSHHESCRIALKWKDNTYETTLTNIEWNTSRTGLVNPIAIFEPVDLEGAVTTKATLHNISYIEDLQLGIGDTITVYRANMVIPKVADNLTRSNTFTVPSVCPECGEATKIRNDNGSKSLHCINPNCKAKLIARLTHFVSKHAMNIDGLSEATLEKFVELGWLNDFVDIYNLQMRNEIIKLDGFGRRSFEKLVTSIEASKKNTTLDRLIYSLSIPNVGRDASKKISNKCKGEYEAFTYLINNKFNWSELDGIGDVINQSIYDYFSSSDNNLNFVMLKERLEVVPDSVETKSNGTSLNGLIFVITGSVNHFKNRDELKEKIESMNGKVSGSVSSKTSYLINNDFASATGKNKTAKELGVKIITEEQFLEMIK